MRNVIPVLTVLAMLILVWCFAVAPMNMRAALDVAERAGDAVVPEGSVTRRDVSVWRLMADNTEHVASGYSLKRPRLPTPVQVGQELWKTTGAMAAKGRAFSKRSLIYHGWITLQSTMWGFLLGTTLGIIGAIAIVYSRVADMSLMPWAVISQTIPIVALAPMIIVLSNQYFPVLVSMVKGLRSPATSELDLLKTYNANGLQGFFKLRLPASMPYLFTSLKVGVAAALVGTIVGELPTGAISGLGARILIGDQFGTPLAIWSALFAAAILAGVLVTVIDLLQKATLHQMGFRS